MTSSRRPVALGRLLAVALAAHASACLFSDQLPDGAAVTCDVDADCPRDYSCSQTLKVCLPPSVDDQEAPVLGDVVLDRDLGGLGAVFRFTFEVSEPLGAVPAARVVADGVERPLSLLEGNVAEDSLEYVMAYTANGTEPQGAFVVEVRLIDKAGNASAGVTLGTIGFDFTPPLVSDETTPAPRFIRAGGEPGVVTFTVDAPIQDAIASVVMRRDGAGGAEDVEWDVLDPGGDDGLSWSFSHIAGVEAEGEWFVFATSLVDLAGNPADEVPLGTVVVDNTPPSVLLEQSSVSPPLLALQGFVQAQIAFSEPLRATPIVLANNGGGLSVPLIEDSTLDDTIQYGARAEEAGTFTVTMVLGAEDLAGNRLQGDVVIGTYVVDDDAPGLASLETNGTAFRGQDTLIVDLTADEALVAPPLVDLGGVPLGLVPDAVTPPAYRYQLPLAGTGLEGDARLSVRMTDLVGKQGVDDDFTIRVDSRAPELVAALVSPTVAPSGATVVLTVTLDEGLGQVNGQDVFPVPTFNSLPGAGFTATRRAGTTYIFTLPIDDQVASGTYDLVRIDVADEAGNTRTIDVANVSFTVDSQPPILSSAVLGAPRYSAIPPLNELVLTLQTDVPAAQVDAALLDRDLECRDDAAGFVVCEYTVDGSEAEGASTILIGLGDDAGNTTFATLPVELDFTPPAVLLLDVSPSPARAGATAFVSLGVSEPLGEAPEVTFAAPPPLTAPVFTDVTQFVPGSLVFAFEHTVLAGEDGSYTVRDIKLVDRVGNSSTAGGGQVFLIDTVAPSVLSAVTRTTNTASPGARDGDTVTVEVTLTEVSASPPVVLIGGKPMDLEPADVDAVTFVYTHPVRVGDEEGPQTITLTTSDPAGNFTVSLLPGATFDFTPPALDGRARVTLVAPAGVAMAKPPQALTVGSTLEVAFEVTEELGAPADVTVGGLSMELVGLGVTVVDASLLLPPEAEEGTNDIVAALVDDVGNEADVTIASVVVDRTAPAALDLGPEGVLVHQRVPFGGDAGGAGGAAVTRVLLAPGAELPPTHTLVVWPRADLQAPPLAVIDTGELGQPAPVELLNADVREVFVELVDGAGNLDAGSPRRLRRMEWVATMRGKVAGSTQANPHRYDVRRRFGPALTEPLAPEASASDGIDVTDGTALLTAGGAEWRQVRFVDPPSPRQRHAMGFDEARGVTVLFGGCTDLDACLNDETWIHDGVSWRLMPRADPERDGDPSGRAGHAMAYSAARGTVLLFGGQTEFGASNETWEWTGDSWRRIAPPTSPPARADHAMAQTEAGRIVLFGGRVAEGFLGDSWLFDGTQWLETFDTTPPKRAAAAMGFDRNLGRVALFGGEGERGVLDDTWLFDDGTLQWAPGPIGAPGVNPVPRKGATLAHSAFNAGGASGLLLFGGEDATGLVDDVRVLTSTGWQPVDFGLQPDARVGHAAIHAKGPNELFLFGGATESGLNDESWAFQNGWAPRDPPGTTAPPARDGAACAVVAGKLVVVGGRAAGNAVLSDAWEWNGNVWREQSTATDTDGSIPPRRERASFGAFEARGVLFGGVDNGVLLGDTWLTDGVTWELLTPADSPSARVGAAVFAASGQFFLFGGSTGLASNETWLLEGGRDWRRLEFPLAPPPSATPLAATEPGGRDAIAFVEGETWRFSGVWEEVGVDDPEGDGAPGPRTGAALISDPDTGVVWLIGGLANGDRLDEVWTWQPRTDSWRRRNPVDLLGDGDPDARDRLCGGAFKDEVFIFGGSTSAVERSDETWALLPGQSTPPAQVMSVNVGPLLGEGVVVEGLRVATIAAGDAPAGPGNILWIFANGWTPLATRIGAGLQPLTAAEAKASTLIVGDTIGVAVSPLGGNDDLEATVSVDSLEVTLELTVPVAPGPP